MEWLPDPYRKNIPGFDYDLEAMRKEYIGRETQPVQARYPVEYDPIRRFCHMTGDSNSLFLDPGYAAKTKYGSVICPPAFVNYFAGQGPWPRGGPVPQTIAIKTPGNRNIVLTIITEWFKPVKIGDRLSTKGRISDLYFCSIRLDWCAVWTERQSIIMNQHGETVAIESLLSLTHREPQQVPEGQKGNPPVPTPEFWHTWGEGDGQRRTPPNGKQWYWEDVKEGDLLPRHEYVINDTTVVLQVSGTQDFYAVHHDHAFAKSGGHADIFVNNGFTRGILGRVLMDFAGDEGWVKKFRLEMRRQNRYGDTTVCTGRVERKYVEDGEHLVECQVWSQNQREGIASPCRAWIALPSRSKS